MVLRSLDPTLMYNFQAPSPERTMPIMVRLKKTAVAQRTRGATHRFVVYSLLYIDITQILASHHRHKKKHAGTAERKME